MKKITVFTILCFSMFLSFGQTKKTIIPIINQTNDYIKLIETKYEQQVVHLEYDVIKSAKESYRELYAGVQYGIILFGDENIKSFNLNISNIENNNWKIINSQNSEKGIIMLYFKPNKTDFYRFNFKSILVNPDTFAYYGFLIFR